MAEITSGSTSDYIDLLGILDEESVKKKESKTQETSTGKGKTFHLSPPRDTIVIDESSKYKKSL